MKKFVDNIPFEMYLEYRDTEWYKSNESIYWYSDETVYFLEHNGRLSRNGDYLVANLDNGCGEVITTIFPSSKQIGEQTFINKYEQFM